MTHTDPDMTRAYQKDHACKVLQVDMLLPFSVEDDDVCVREPPATYALPQRNTAFLPQINFRGTGSGTLLLAIAGNDP